MEPHHIEPELHRLLNESIDKSKLPPKPTVKDKPPKYKMYLFGIAVLICLLTFLTIFLLKNDSPRTDNNAAGFDSQVVGVITHPNDRAIVHRNFIAAGYTENIPDETPYIWFVVDVNSIGQCWPQKPVIKPNSKFRIKLYEGGPNPNFTLSLYAVDKSIHKKIMEWFKENDRIDHNAGFSVIPNKYKLDSALLELQD